MHHTHPVHAVLSFYFKMHFNSVLPIYSQTFQVDSLLHVYPPKPYMYLPSPLYVVWQKSNETDFLLTMNFILFTNQGYFFQNSSLGLLHSDGGIVSIVRSSAGRLLLEYLSAHQLRSSGYYPKCQNGALSSGF